jgi:hypothetical protein
MFIYSDLRAINTLYLSYNETMNARINSNIAARSLNHCRRGKSKSITYFEYVPAALVMHLVKSMRSVISSSVTCPALPHFSTLSHTALFSGREETPVYRV